MNIAKPLNSIKQALQKSARSIASALLLVLLGIVLVSVITVLLNYKKDTLLPKVKEGELNLTTVNLDKNLSVPINGEWEFYWSELLTSSDIQTRLLENPEFAPTYTKVPHVWLDMPDVNGVSRKKGYATYRVKIKVPHDATNLAIRVPSVGSAFSMYVDGNLIANAGKVAEFEQDAVPEYRAGIFNFDVSSKSFELIIQVSNYDLVWGGIWDDIRIGKAGKVQLEQSQRNFRATAVIVAFLTIAVFNLVQYSLRPGNIPPLLIASICILLGLRELETSSLLSFLEIHNFAYSTNIYISFLSFYVTAGLLMAFYAWSFRREYNRIIVNIVYAMSGIFSLSVLVLPAYLFTQFTFVFQVFCLFIIAYIIWGLVLAVKRKRPSANIILLGTVILYGLMLNDLLMSMRVIESVPLINLGLVALIFCKNFAIYSRFIYAIEQNQFLSGELAEQNKALEKFTESLEELVQSRTKELSNANAQLEVLAFNDSLTGLLNRRGLIAEVDKAKRAFEQQKTPFCFLLLDFDHFKKLNDTLGHDAGDTVLVQGAQNIKTSVLENAKVGRWGGEEFLILLNNMRLDDARKTAEGIRVVVYELVSEKVGTKVSVSIGVCEFTGDESIEKAINRADEALYAAKTNGRNRVEVSNKGGPVS